MKLHLQIVHQYVSDINYKMSEQKSYLMSKQMSSLMSKQTSKSKAERMNNMKKEVNKNVPDCIIKSLARLLMPEIQKFYETDENKKNFDQCNSEKERRNKTE